MLTMKCSCCATIILTEDKNLECFHISAKDDFNSSDSEDDDYVPDKGELSSEEEGPILSVCKDENKKRELKNKSGKVKLESRDEKISKDEEPKKTSDDIYKSFLEEVESEMKSSSGLSCGSLTSSPALSSSSLALSSSSPATAVNNAKSSSSLSTPDKPSIDFFDFAGEIVSVNKESGTLVASKTDNIPSESEKPVPTPAIKRKGIGSVLGSIMDKKKKLSTLEKTNLDWRAFKESEGICEELERFNKGKQGYIERQRFLQRSDIRSFEIERDMRLSKGKKN